MLKVLKIEKNVIEDGVVTKSYGYIYADSKSEVVDGATVEGLGDIGLMATGSICITSDFEVGMKTSSGTWSWA